MVDPILENGDAQVTAQVPDSVPVPAAALKARAVREELQARDALPLPGPLKAECPCGCGTFGTVRQKMQRDGLQHVTRCPCRRCKAPRHKSNASARERRIAKDTGGERSVLSGALSGYDGRSGLHVWEETSQVAITKTFRKWVESKGVTDKLERLMNLSGYNRHFILSWDGKPRWVITPYSDWAAGVRAVDEPDTP